MSGLVKTDEQIEIMMASKMFDKLKVDAKAGSGKTSTLVMVAEDNPVRSLYITFNKNMQEEAQKKFPHWVEVKTTHGLAYHKFGRPLTHKLTRPRGEYKNVCGTGAEIARHFKIAPFVVSASKSISGTAMGYAVKSTLARFEYSADVDFEDHHVSFKEAEKVFDDPMFSKKEYRRRILKFAKMLWKDRIDIASPIQATHDTYLKLFQLSNPDLSEYEMIYVDEAHDSSACLMDVIFKQNTRIVLVGDPYQAIYGWRGAINAMENTDWETRHLSKSFRFGPKVAEVAKDILLDQWGGRNVQIEGFEKLDTKVVGVHNEKKFTWLFRTNAGLIGEAVELIEQGKKVNIEVDVADFRSMLMSGLALRAGNMKNVKHHDLVSFNTWEEFEEDIEVSKRGELKRIYNYISGGVANKILKALDNYKPCKDADIHMITAHKSKGLEFDVVVLANDFQEFQLDDDGDWIGWPDQERNLFYVSATRAKKVLVLNSILLDLRLFLKGRERPELRVESFGIERYNGQNPIDLDEMVKVKMVELGGIVPTDMDLFLEGTPNSNPNHWTFALDGCGLDSSEEEQFGINY